MSTFILRAIFEISRSEAGCVTEQPQAPSSFHLFLTQALKNCRSAATPLNLTYSYPAPDQTYLMKIASTFQAHHLRPNNNILLANLAFSSPTPPVHTIPILRLEAQHPTQACSFVRFKVVHKM